MAAKSKQKKNNKVKIYSKYGKSMSWKRGLIFGLAFGVIGLAVLLKSFAASSIHYYYYNTGNNGLGFHHTGNHQVMPSGNLILATDQLVNVNVWAVNSNQVNGSAMWFGPYVNIPGHNHILKVCWEYYAGTTKDATMIFDVVYHTPGVTHPLWNVNRVTKTIPHVPLDPANLYAESPQPNPPYCITKQLDNRDVYGAVEFRVQPISVGSDSFSSVNGLNNDFRIWRTSWQLL
ncbi:MAG TPA: hypothetical protein VLF90_04450 [Patescibacteria group bacterium]|nr:hypothetical protein [Patescibacteria group bacterium]